MRRAGFTLVEILTVIVVLATLATIMAPNLASGVKANAKRSYLASVDRMPAKARQLAIQSGVPAILISDEDGNLSIQQVADENSDPVVSEQVQAIGDVVPDRFVIGEDESVASEWQVRFFADGTSDRAGLEFDDNGARWSLAIDGQGNGHVRSGELPDLAVDRWEAGDFVQRS